MTADSAQDPADAAQALRQRGYAVFEDVLDREQVATVRAAIERLAADVDPPAYHSARTRVLDDMAMLAAPGLALPRLLTARPDLAPLVLHPPVVATLRRLLGDDLVLELAGAVVSDETRPFFSWHTHIDGVDEGERLQTGVWPTPAKSQRVLTLLYLDDLDDDAGPLYVLPRREGEPTAPPADPSARRWPGQVELRPRAGSLVALEQCTWHAAASRRTRGHRVFVGCYWAAANVRRPDWADPSLADRLRT